MRALQLLFALVTYVTTIEGQCSISINKDLPKVEPLILRPGPGSGFRYPTKEGILQFSKQEQVRLVCNGEGNRFKNLGLTHPRNDIIAECEANKQFKVLQLGVTKDFKDLECYASPQSEQKVTGSCSKSLTNYAIGFAFSNEFIKLIELCHDPERVETLYTKFELAKEIKGARTAPVSAPFEECPKHHLRCNEQYNRSVQIDTIGRILGSVKEAEKYIQEKSYINYLARGHFAAKADFIYTSQRLATFYYINQAPQWQSCNNQQWKVLERRVRIFASETGQDLTVYTGVHEIAQLPDKDNVKRDLYLSVDSVGKGSIPVPRFFWKVIYNEKTQLGTAFVGINDPRQTTSSKICGEFIQDSRWGKKDDEKWACKAYTCGVDELRKHVNFPQFTVTGVLNPPTQF